MNPHTVTLTGQVVRLEPLAEAHVADLAAVGLDAPIWQYMLYGEVRTEAQLRSWVHEILQRQARGTDVAFAVIDLPTGCAMGATRYMDIRPEHRSLEIGGTWYGLAYQGTAVNPECKYLLMRHAFEVLGVNRIQLKTDLRNTRSQRAIERLGAVKEGVLRDHLITPSGYMRSSVYYSVLAAEWPAIKARLEARLPALYVAAGPR